MFGDAQKLLKIHASVPAPRWHLAVGLPRHSLQDSLDARHPILAAWVWRFWFGFWMFDGVTYIYIYVYIYICSFWMCVNFEAGTSRFQVLVGVCVFFLE